jgi:hypothetical protein
MKFFISFFFCTNLYASPIQIFHENAHENAQQVREIFTTGYQIPEDLIMVKSVESCEMLKERGKLDLCLKNNGDLLVVSVDKRFVSESLRIFQAP